jgi:hypothetical protein
MIKILYLAYFALLFLVKIDVASADAKRALNSSFQLAATPCKHVLERSSSFSSLASDLTLDSSDSPLKSSPSRKLYSIVINNLSNSAASSSSAESSPVATWDNLLSNDSTVSKVVNLALTGYSFYQTVHNIGVTASIVARMSLVGCNYYFGTKTSDDTMTKETQENQPVPTIEKKKETDEEAHYDARKQPDEMADLKNEVAELKKLLQQSSNNSHACSSEEYIREYSSSPSVHRISHYQ